MAKGTYVAENTYMAESTGRKCVCPVRLELMTAVQRHFSNISQLMASAAAAMEAGQENSALELDKMLESEVGEKERALGALHQHRIEHGC
jgi:hypothetical protein